MLPNTSAALGTQHIQPSGQHMAGLLISIPCTADHRQGELHFYSDLLPVLSSLSTQHKVVWWTPAPLPWYA